AGGQRTFVITANPEFVMLARGDADLGKIARSADLVVADGTGVLVASRMLRDPLPGRVPGRLLVPAVLQLASGPVFLLGAAPRVAVAARVLAAPVAAPACPAGLRRPRRAAAHPSPMKLTLAHEYFVMHGGAERVAETLHQMWPDAPVYTFFHDRRRYGDLPGWTLRTSYLQHLLLGESHRLLLPLYPNAARALRVPPDTDVALVPTSAFVKGIGLADRTVAVAYCHSPTRYLYDWSDRYLQEEVPAPLVPLVRDLLGRLRD